MQTVEQKYGIPTFETCKKLSEYWKEETLFTIFKGYKEYICVDFTDKYFDTRNEYYQAPQTDELLKALKKEIKPFEFNHSKNIKLGVNLTDKDIYFWTGKLKYFYYKLDDTNTLVECLARIYIALQKEKELL